MFVWYFSRLNVINRQPWAWPCRAWPSDCEWMVPGTVDPND